VISSEFVHSKGRPLLLLVGEALFVLCIYGAYSVVRILVEGSEGDAFDNALKIISIEKDIGIFHELKVQRAFAAVPGLLLAMEAVYRFTYLPVLVVGASGGYLRDQSIYKRYRSAFFMSLAIGLVFFALLPVAPPRLLPEYGFLDVIRADDIAESDGVRNNYAAVPSFHFGLPLLITIGFCHAFRLKPWHCILAALLPTTMLLAIVSTANHFFIDAAIGAAVVLFSAWWCVWRVHGIWNIETEPSALALRDPS
jgi:hypothetical protein